MPIDQTKTLADFFRLMNLNGAAQVYHESLRAGILESLTHGPRSAGAIATACGIAERPTTLMLDVLEVLGLVEKESQNYHLTMLALMLLGGSYRTLGNQYWAHLSEFLKTDQPIVKMDSLAESEQHYQAQAEALAWMSGPGAALAANLLAPDTPPGARILDIGAGSAIWSLALAKLIPQSTIMAVDWPGVLQIAQKTAKRFKLDDRLTTIAGNYHEVEFPKEIDVAFLANVTHLETLEGNQSLFQKAHASLKPGGRLVILDALPGMEAGDLNRALYALGLALRTQQGRVCTPAELSGFLSAANFADIESIPLNIAPHALGMMVATRPL